MRFGSRDFQEPQIHESASGNTAAEVPETKVSQSSWNIFQLI
jgi:hypothetical protein